MVAGCWLLVAGGWLLVAAGGENPHSRQTGHAVAAGRADVLPAVQVLWLQSSSQPSTCTCFTTHQPDTCSHWPASHANQPVRGDH